MRKIGKFFAIVVFFFLVFILLKNKIGLNKVPDKVNIELKDPLSEKLIKKIIDITIIILNENRKAELEKIKLGNPMYIRLFKEEKKLEIWIQNDSGKYSFYKEFDICYFSGGLGPKKKEGDRKSPEGFYSTIKSSLNPNSSYHLSFNIGYPNEYDKSHGYTGSLIMIHGNCVSLGCYAMTDKYIEEIYGLVDKTLNNGHKKINVDVFPFKMTEFNMEKYEDCEYYNFWEQLKPEYDYFEINRIPPKMIVENKKYKLLKLE